MEDHVWRECLTRRTSGTTRKTEEFRSLTRHARKRVGLSPHGRGKASDSLSPMGGGLGWRTMCGANV